MELDREVDSVLMNISKTSGGVVSALLFSATMSFKLVTFLMRMAKKGLVASGFTDAFKSFNDKTAGEYTVYNIPLTKDKAIKMDKLNELNLELENEKNPIKAAEIRNEIKSVQNEIPEIAQLKQLEIEHCVLPKLNGSNHTIQVAINNVHDQRFKNWYLNHLTTGLSGGKTNLESIKVFTEGNYTILNMPFEEKEELKAMFKDFDKMKVNYAKCPDLSVGDGYTQIAIPNADRNLVETWFNLWKNKQIVEGKEVNKEMYALDENSYMATGELSPEEYINNADEVYKEVNAEFEKASEKIPWTTKMKHENSPEFVKFIQDQNYEKITINHNKLSQMDTSNIKFLLENAEKRGMFVTRIPYTWGDKQEILILPRNQVFTTDEDKTYVAFLDKRKDQMHIDANGTVVKKSFDDTYKQYEKVKRGFKEVDKLRQGKSLEPVKNVVKDAVSKSVPSIVPKV